MQLPKVRSRASTAAYTIVDVPTPGSATTSAVSNRRDFKTKDIVFTIALAIFIAAVVGAIITYCIDSVIDLYREHKRSRALGMRVLDIEVQLFFVVPDSVADRPVMHASYRRPKFTAFLVPHPDITLALILHLPMAFYCPLGRVSVPFFDDTMNDSATMDFPIHSAYIHQ